MIKKKKKKRLHHGVFSAIVECPLYKVSVFYTQAVSKILHTISVFYRGTSLMRKRPPPQEHHGALDIGLL